MSARSVKSLSAEEILAKTCANALSDGPSDVLEKVMMMIILTVKVIVILSMKLQGT
jgi:hypothetical protein